MKLRLVGLLAFGLRARGDEGEGEEDPHGRESTSEVVRAEVSCNDRTLCYRQIVVRVLLVCSLAACSFDYGFPEPSGGGGGSGGFPNPTAPDAAVVVMIDAPVMPPVDGPCADDDADGVCNAVDDWPCGAKPTQPNATIAWSGNSGATDTSITSVNLDSTGRLAIATTQEIISLRFNYAISDTACAGNCIDQIEIGWTPGNRYGCPFDQVVSKQNGAAGTITTTIRAPNTTGTYDLRVNLGQNTGCFDNGANDWWGMSASQDPAATRTIAKLCVR
ncbi:MAG TPA: hypothetical protein VIV11_30335 [Kofleriaceae bacterium]